MRVATVCAIHAGTGDNVIPASTALELNRAILQFGDA